MRHTAAAALVPHALLFKRLLRTGDENLDEVLSASELAAGLLPVRAEKTAVKKEGSRLPGADALTLLVARIDVNGDSRLELTEASAADRRVLQQMLRIADDDKDSALDPREIARAAPRLGLQAQAAALRAGLDIDAELAKLPASRRSAVEQMGAYPRPGEILADPQLARQLFQRFDANADGRLSAEEAPPALAERFPRLIRRGDRDGDGQFSQAEFLDVARRIARLQRISEAGPADGEMRDAEAAATK
ncbi:MAG: hypothetical protein DCC67_10525 [Planctomycetota bacterium]|nr:MAG: hypothetical protein DCC67_10525 [Planctomycetota bacterium]